LLLSYSALAGQSENEESFDPPSNAIGFNVTSLLTALVTPNDISSVWFEYQCSIIDYLGLTLDVEYLYFDTKVDVGQIEEFNAYGIGILVGPRILFSGSKLHGFYLSALFGYGWMSGEGMYVPEDTANVFTIGGEAGYSFANNEGFVLTAGLGADYRIIKFDRNMVDDRNKICPRIVINLGYGW
jgi:hypothetical protein